MAHTPGPWVHGSNGKRFNPSIVFAADGASSIATVYGIWTNKDFAAVANDPLCAQGMANARLIAAAPDLLNELRRTREWVAQYLDIPGHADAARFKVNAIDAVIAKAEGK